MDLNLPGGHFVQLDCPLSDHNPAPHVTQADAVVDLGLGLTVPAAQRVHGARPVADQDPALQTSTQSSFDLDPDGDDMLLGHSMQSFKFVDPGVGLYVPAGHDSQEEACLAPTLLLQVPAGQTAHALCPWFVE
jgi:hypothetical protein